jgi:hypothetical protein
LQMVKQLILLSSCMNKVTFRFTDNFNALNVARAMHNNHCWFYELVSAANVHFRCIEMNELETRAFSEIDMEELSIRVCLSEVIGDYQ